MAEYRLELVAARFSELMQETALKRGWHFGGAEWSSYRRVFSFDAFAPERFHGSFRREGGIGEGRNAVYLAPPKIHEQAWRWTMDLDVVLNEMDRIDPGGWVKLMGRTQDQVERRAAERLFPMIARELPQIEGWRPEDVERRLATVKAEAARRLFLLEGLLINCPPRVEASRG